eukprot:CAMPEP_0114331956 /NCGR_PEP_ID=MMETSP0101-20121206/2759_1 /TAXON_ID=38822 ORGANISM="Pteridomonas danica, Strain PT" /NCGR_SAMPLE_ID=MMETSP0101 /ASSEMBLY_ACC=CAM_ASM_000211 /LENGTH=41 /DNA_ID= /DNA_START= /DNA_END= /DNA_ORIENTATION=
MIAIINHQPPRKTNERSFMFLFDLVTVDRFKDESDEDGVMT